MIPSYRLKEIDFLRGLAVIMVLFRHFPFTYYTITMGWIGVDLFFVLSGFLVSGLLFSEYQKFGNIRIRLFLIRRGFKIYPLFYIFILSTVICDLLSGTQISKSKLLSELFSYKIIWAGYGTILGRLQLKNIFTLYYPFYYIF